MFHVQQSIYELLDKIICPPPAPPIVKRPELFLFSIFYNIKKSLLLSAYFSLLLVVGVSVV
jgi:hypothetical protein